ncbi:MAG: DUF4266 domain-containing protein [Telluria sp.]
MMGGRCRSALVCLAWLPLLAASGCALEPVAPWQKGNLARPEMRFGADRLETMFGEHVYSSKETASGGNGEAGGGCGCY